VGVTSQPMSVRGGKLLGRTVADRSPSSKETEAQRTMDRRVSAPWLVHVAGVHLDRRESSHGMRSESALSVAGAHLKASKRDRRHL
jgi:hypothetical protein